MLSRRAMRRMASPNSPATDTHLDLGREAAGLRLHAVGHEEALDGAVVEAVAGRRRRAARGSPRRRPTIAPRSMTTRAASISVPAEMVKSSTIRAVGPRPTRSARRSRPTRCGPRGACRRWRSGARRRLAHSRAFLAKPASGATTTRSCRPLAAMASHSTGSAYRSSTGIRKKPWTWGACRSSVTTRSAPGGLDGVGADPGPDRHPGLVLLVALGVAEVRDHRGDRRGAGPLERVDPEQQLHEVVVGREGRALHQEHVAAPDVLQHPHEEVALGEAQRLRRPQLAPEVLGDRAGPGCRLAEPANSRNSSSMPRMLRTPSGAVAVVRVSPFAHTSGVHMRALRRS